MFGVMDVIKLPEDSQFEVKLFFQKTQSSRDNQMQLDEFLGQISPSLQMRVNGHIYRKNILANNVVCKFMNINEDYIEPKITQKMIFRKLKKEILSLAARVAEEVPK